MSSDALRAVLDRIPLQKRLEMAIMDSEVFELAVCLDKIKAVILYDNSTLLGMDADCCQDVCSYRTKEIVRKKDGTEPGAPNPHYLDKILEHCPAMQSLFVQTRLSSDSLRLLVTEKTNTLKQLVISNENFSSDWPAELQEHGFCRLKTLRILQRANQSLRIGPKITPQRIKPVLSPTLEHLSLTGCFLELPMLQQLFSATSLPHLRTMDLIGCLVDSTQASHLIPELQMPPRLEKVTLPPSLFSFSATATKVKFDLKWLKCQQLGVYMEAYQNEVFHEEVETLLAKETQILEVYGNWSKMKATYSSGKAGKMKKIKMLYNDSSSQVLVPSWAQHSHDNSLLIGHLVRSSPYTRAEMRTRRAEKWQFDSMTAIEDEPLRVVQRQDDRRQLGNRLFHQVIGRIRRGQVPQAPPPPLQNHIQPPRQPQNRQPGQDGQPSAADAALPAQNGQPPNDVELALIVVAIERRS